MFLPFYDPTFLLLIPSLIFALWTQFLVKSIFKKYSKVHAASGLTGGVIARNLLRDGGLDDVSVEEVGGKLTDHYDPRERILGFYFLAGLSFFNWLHFRSNLMPVPEHWCY